MRILSRSVLLRDNLQLIIFFISVGHGQSEGDRVHVDLFQEYVDDAFLHADKIKKDFPDIPMFVLGHSMVR